MSSLGINANNPEHPTDSVSLHFPLLLLLPLPPSSAFPYSEISLSSTSVSRTERSHNHIPSEKHPTHDFFLNRKGLEYPCPNRTWNFRRCFFLRLFFSVSSTKHICSLGVEIAEWTCFAHYSVDDAFAGAADTLVGVFVYVIKGGTDMSETGSDRGSG
jgi:hypothetical protein